MKRGAARLGVLGMLLAACVGNGQGLDINGRPLEQDSAAPVAEADSLATDGGTDPMSGDGASTFGQIQDEIFTPICAGECHVGAQAPKGLDLSAGNSWRNLASIASAEVPTLQRVNPSRPDVSYLLIKLVAIDSRRVGSRMPRNGPPYLTDEQIELIRTWIGDGGASPP